MGLVRVRVRVENPFSGSSLSTEAIVDTGASFSVIPARLDEVLRLPRSGRVVNVRTAMGVDSLEEAVAVMEFEGVRGFTSVLVSGKLDVALIGVLTLEAFGFEVDPVTGRLRRVPIYLL